SRRQKGNSRGTYQRKNRRFREDVGKNRDPYKTCQTEPAQPMRIDKNEYFFKGASCRCIELLVVSPNSRISRRETHIRNTQHARAGQDGNDRDDHTPALGLSNIDRSTCNPRRVITSQNSGMIPVAANAPWTLPFSSNPVWRKPNISAICTVSPSIPVTSEMLVTLRDPQAKRVCWMMM